MNIQNLMGSYLWQSYQCGFHEKL